MSRTIDSSTSERAFQASQSVFTLRSDPTDRVLADRACEQRRTRRAAAQATLQMYRMVTGG